MSPYPFIAIEGVIGVGKTTLARYLQEAISATLLLEVFEENPFLSDFYADKTRYAFQVETFFLLSRYRQLHQVVPDILSQNPLVTDYLFVKNWLFANLNLVNDELAVFKNLYSALAERIPATSLVIYLRASVDTLMERIAIRDRPYERNMSRVYIANLAEAYDTYFNDYTQSPVVTIDTNELNIVHDLEARQALIGRIKSVINDGARQPSLLAPDSPIAETVETVLNGPSRRLSDFQQFHRGLDESKGFDPDFFFNYILLTEEMGELGQEVGLIWRIQNRLKKRGISETAALKQALDQHRASLQGELADCLAYLLKLANYSGIDLEKAYLEKMQANIDRNWSEGQSKR